MKDCIDEAKLQFFVEIRTDSTKYRAPALAKKASAKFRAICIFEGKSLFLQIGMRGSDYTKTAQGNHNTIYDTNHFFDRIYGVWKKHPRSSTGIGDECAVYRPRRLH